MIQNVEKTEWGQLLDRISKTLAASLVEVELDALDLGNQVEAEWLPLIGIAYDHKDDLIEIALKGLDHTIRRPRELYVDENNGRVECLGILDGTTQIVQFKEPLLLPSRQ
jgi:hypothetical protein